MTDALIVALCKALKLTATPQLQRLQGGDTASAWCLVAGDSQFFLKTTPLKTGSDFESEADGLDKLAQASLTVPKVTGFGDCETHHWLALEWLQLAPLNAETGVALGRGLAEMHGTTAPQFGWHRDNQIGRSRQQNVWTDSWPRFFATQRLLPMRDRLIASASEALLAGIDELIDQLPARLAGHELNASLLHGDLWTGNAAGCGSGAAVFDPACYFGDREADIAMSRLFGGFPASFYAAYESVWPLPQGHEDRAPLYNLYHVLNHAVLFGGGYLQQAQAVLRNLGCDAS